MNTPMMVPSAMPFQPDQTLVAQLCTQFGLTYHLNFISQADQLVGLRGKSVIEIGGSLPKEFVFRHLGVHQWIGVEEMSYWAEVGTTGVKHGTMPIQAPFQKVRELHPDVELPEYGVLDGAFEELPDHIVDRFDVAYSCACFEHVLRMPQLLRTASRVLKPGGMLFAMYSPIWSAWDGHHLPKIKDGQGRDHSFGTPLIPPWGHLLLSPPEMLSHLTSRIDRSTAERIVYYLYHSPHINRLFTEDYVGYFLQSGMEVVHLQAVFQRTITDELQKRLEARWPGRKQFANNGIRVVLRKPVAAAE